MLAKHQKLATLSSKIPRLKGKILITDCFKLSMLPKTYKGPKRKVNVEKVDTAMTISLGKLTLLLSEIFGDDDRLIHLPNK
jgi:hypothetical protein